MRTEFHELAMRMMITINGGALVLEMQAEGVLFHFIFLRFVFQVVGVPASAMSLHVWRGNIKMQCSLFPLTGYLS